MALSDRDIRRYIAEGKIRIHPPIDEAVQLGPCSVDLTLSNSFAAFEYSRLPYIDTRRPAEGQTIMRTIEVADDEPFVLQPGELVLASTRETLELDDDVLARLEGRSSLARLGIIVHGTAGVFDPGWRGKAVLELGNLGRMAVALYPGMRICAFSFETVSSSVMTPYRDKINNKYAGQVTPRASQLSEENRLAAEEASSEG